MKAKRRVPAPERKVKNLSKERSVNFLKFQHQRERGEKGEERKDNHLSGVPASDKTGEKGEERTITFFGLQHQSPSVGRLAASLLLLAAASIPLLLPVTLHLPTQSPIRPGPIIT